MAAGATEATALAIASGLGAAVGVSVFDAAAMAAFGVNAIVVIFALVGAVAAIAYSDPIRPMVRMIALLVANTMLGIVAALSLRFLPGLEWTQHIPSQAVSFSVAFSSLWLIPILIKKIPEFVGSKRLQGQVEKGETNA